MDLGTPICNGERCDPEHYCNRLDICTPCLQTCKNPLNKEECRRKCPGTFNSLYPTTVTYTTNTEPTTLVTSPSNKSGPSVSGTLLPILLPLSIILCGVLILIFVCCRCRRHKAKNGGVGSGEKVGVDLGDIETSGLLVHCPSEKPSINPNHIRTEYPEAIVPKSTKTNISTTGEVFNLTNSTSFGYCTETASLSEHRSLLLSSGTSFRDLSVHGLRNDRVLDYTPEISRPIKSVEEIPQNNITHGHHGDHGDHGRGLVYSGTAETHFSVGEIPVASPIHVARDESHQSTQPTDNFTIPTYVPPVEHIILSEAVAEVQFNSKSSTPELRSHIPVRRVESQVSQLSAVASLNLIEDQSNEPGQVRGVSASPPRVTEGNTSQWNLIIKMYDAVDAQMHKLPFIAGCMIGGEALQVYVRTDPEHDLQSCYNQILNILPREANVQQLLVVQPE